jgi:prepilin-type N-terminal cleavage/methylation domain-containing protein/prepilin-type processing-associated H-X9-DG protein
MQKFLANSESLFSGSVPNNFPNSVGGRRGFTLVEFLVVIAVVAILAALLFPVIKSMEDSSRGAVCMSNLRQVGIGLHLYASENKNSFPKMYNVATGKLWNEMLVDGGYLPDANKVGQHSVLLCPSQTPKKWKEPSYTYGMRVPPAPATMWNGDWWQYRMTGGNIGDINNQQYGPGSQFMMVGDSVYIGGGPAENQQFYYFQTNSNVLHVAHLRHKNHGNFLFGDGHVAALDTAALLDDPVNPTLPSQISTASPQ